MARSEWEVGNSSYSGNPVPVEDEQGYGHWRETVMDTELMTPFAEAPGTTNQWSSITAAALGDMGYTVDLSSAEIDPYTVANPSASSPSQSSAEGAVTEDEQQPFDIVLKPRMIKLPDGRIILLGR